MTPSSLKIIRDEHSSLAAMLQSTRMLVERGPQDDARGFFDVLRAMLFYIDEFPERLHHPKETELLFPRVLKAAPDTATAIARLDHDHEYTEKAVRDLQHLLIAWELMGESRRAAFTKAFTRYVDLYLSHMHLEEQEILPAAVKHLTAEDWQALDAAFEANRDPLTGHYAPEKDYERLFSRIVMAAPAPIGLGS
ncbi:MAG: hemerythrin domain-containing protein [Burkholderiales bacterium]|uniref:Hemerythrin domain-containing protein n=1 Tax=Ottowia pentelensis TaxID=511108 RepID=A0ABV6PWZ0_9BURK|nr:hemerythrin domain-containing protein [Burkholderiales bacterium]MBS0415490.1 hemerythrin domain-containing protein [Pseudomonadota bacterium]